MAEKVEAPVENPAKGYAPATDESPTLNADTGSHAKHNWQGFKVQGGPAIQMCVHCGKTKTQED